MKPKKPTAENINKFSEETNLPKETATKILDVLYKQGLDAKQLDRLLRKMQMFIQKTAIPDLMNKMSAAQIGTLVEEMIAEDEKDECCNPSMYSEKEMTLWSFTDISEDFSDKVFAAGDKVEIQIMRAGKWNHSMYGEVKITPETISDVKKNFDENTRGIDLAVDENHEPNHKALGWFRELTKKGKDSLFATIELTKKGAELMTEGAYKYFSPEITFNKIDEESGKSIKNLLIGGAFTNRPFFKAMQPLLASEEGGTNEAADRHQEIESFTASDSNNILFFNTSKSMKTILELIALFCEKTTINAQELAQLESAFNEMKAEDKTAELTSAVNEIKEKFSEETASEDKVPEDKTADEKTEDKVADEAPASEDKGSDAATDDKAEDKVPADLPETAVPAEEKKIEANEKGEVTIQMSEYESMKAIASEHGKLVKEARKNESAKAFSELFTTLEKDGVIFAPKDQKKFSEFGVKLSEPLEKEFRELISSVKTVKAGEMGHSEEGTEDFSELNQEGIQFYTEKMGFTKEEAAVAMKLAASAKKQ